MRGSSRKIFIALILLTGFFAQVALAAHVRFEGVTKADRIFLEQKIPALATPHPTVSALDEAIRDLMETNQYQTVSVFKSDSGAYTLVGLILRRIGAIEVGGNRAISKTDILHALGLKIGMRLDTVRLENAIEKVKELYGKRGYFNAIVGFSFAYINPTEVKLLVSVRERPPCIITDVHFLSSNSHLNKKLRHIIRDDINRPFAENTVLNIENDVNDYLRGHRFINAVLSEKNVNYNAGHTTAVLNYEISDPYSYQLFIYGTKYYTDRDVIRDLHLGSFTRGSHDPALDITNEIRANYVRTGFPNVKIRTRQRVFKHPMIKRLIIHIKEGSRVAIDKIEILGRISRPAQYYASFIESHSSSIVSRGYYVKVDLDNGFKNLITELNNQGYLRAKIVSDRVAFNKKGTEVRVIVTLDEGPLTELTHIQFSGVHAYTPQKLLKQISLQPNTPLHLNHLEDSIHKLISFYENHGYLEMRLLNENQNLVTYSPDGLAATVHFDIYEGPQIYVKSIDIEGNTITKDFVIRRYLTVKPGDLLTPALLEENRRLLEETNLFSSVDIHTLYAGTKISHRPLAVVVTDRNPGLFKVGVGVTNKNGITARGRGGISYNNIAGTGRAVSLYGVIESSLIHPNWLEYEVDAGYKEPFLFDTRWMGRINVGHSEYLLNIANNQLLATDLMTLSAERDINSHTKLTWVAWGLNGESEYTIPSFGSRIMDYSVRIAYIGPILDINYTDNRFLPSEGSSGRWDAIYAAPAFGSSNQVDFYRTEATVAHYTRLFGSKNWVWSNEVRGGYEKNISKIPGSGVPLSYAFFLGGYDTLEGYSGYGNDRDPNGVEFPINPSTDLYVIPRSSDYYLLRSEIRYPIYGSFGGVVFYDAGEVDIAGQVFHDPLRQSAGIGFRINTPVGPLSLDYGQKLNRQPGESPGAIQLYIGTF